MSSSRPTELARRPVSVPQVSASKVRAGADPMVMVTAYDAPGARMADAAGVDMILVKCGHCVAPVGPAKAGENAPGKGCGWWWNCGP